MPRQLALLLCTAFVLFLLRLERRAAPDVSAASWIPTIWLLAVSSKALGVWLGLAGGREAGSVPDQLLLAALAMSGIAVAAARGTGWSGVLTCHKWVLLVLAYMFASTLWSDITLIALRRWVREVIVVIMALVVVSERNPSGALEAVLRRAAYILVPFSLMLIKYYTALGTLYGTYTGSQTWVGVAYHKNSLGRLCVISAFFLIWALYRQWRTPSTSGRHRAWADLAVLLITLFILRGADEYSATSIATLTMGITVCLALMWLQKRQLMVPRGALVAMVILVVGSGALAPFVGGSNLAAFTSTLGRDATLTGRTEIWAALVPVFWERPLLGCGFGSFWTSARQASLEILSAHNGYLDILLELGFVGLALYAAWLLSCARELHRALAANAQGAILAVCFFAMALIYNTTESSLISLAENLSAIMVISSITASIEASRAPSAESARSKLAGAAPRVINRKAWQTVSRRTPAHVRVVSRRGGRA